MAELARSECFCCGKILGPRQLSRHLNSYQLRNSNSTSHNPDVNLDTAMEEPADELHAEHNNNEGVFTLVVSVLYVLIEYRLWGLLSYRAHAGSY